jgi:hypothetical protein
VISDYPVNVGSREGEIGSREGAIGQTGASEGLSNTTPECELPSDPTPTTEKTRLTEEGI